MFDEVIIDYSDDWEIWTKVLDAFWHPWRPNMALPFCSTSSELKAVDGLRQTYQHRIALFIRNVLGLIREALNQAIKHLVEMRSELHQGPLRPR